MSKLTKNLFFSQKGIRNINVLSSHSLFKGNQSFFSTKKIGPKKDYYAILGVSKTASLEEIKKAYRTMAKKYHPDVNSKQDTSENTVLKMEKFRDIAEAYAVLSNGYSKQKYDTTYAPNPSAVYNASKMQAMNESAQQRDYSGNTPKAPYEHGSYADFKMMKHKEWQKTFNFDHLGNFKGGVPQPNKGKTRGSSLGVPGDAYDAYHHNEEFVDNPIIKPIENLQSITHKHFNAERKIQNQRFRPYFNIQERKSDEQYFQSDEYRNTMRFPLFLMISLLGFFLTKRILHDNNYINLKDHIENLKAHEVEVRGPLLLEAHKFKETKKFLTRKEYHKWLLNDLRVFHEAPETQEE